MLKKNLFLLFSVTFIAITSAALSIFNYNPYTAQTYQHIIFYVSFFLSISGILSFLIFYSKIIILKKETVYILFWPSIRQASIISTALTLILILRGLKLLDIWIGIPLTIAILMLELFFQTKRKAS